MTTCEVCQDPDVPIVYLYCSGQWVCNGCRRQKPCNRGGLLFAGLAYSVLSNGHELWHEERLVNCRAAWLLHVEKCDHCAQFRWHLRQALGRLEALIR